MKTHKDLNVWQNSIHLVKIIYELTSKFPTSELYSLTSQLRRASVSIPSNIAEGAARSYDKEFIHFLSISSGSLSEVETQIIIAAELGFINELEKEKVLNSLIEIRAQLNGLIKHLRNKESKE
ncbi:MAG: four helix bundle protein [Melioribacteraceae bacterium]